MEIQKVDIAKIFKEYRREFVLTQEELALKIGVKRSRLGSYEDGRARPNIDDLIKISESLGFKTVDAFLKIQMDNISTGEIEQLCTKLTSKNKNLIKSIIKHLVAQQ